MFCVDMSPSDICSYSSNGLIKPGVAHQAHLVIATISDAMDPRKESRPIQVEI